MKDENRTINIELYCRYKRKRVALVDLLNELLNQNEEKQERIDKAIEYIENHKFNKFGDIDCGEAETIINILNGGDE
jgi:hypothetical protein